MPRPRSRLRRSHGSSSGRGQLGYELRLRGASDELIALIAFVGLDSVLRVDAGGQPEEGEQRLGVEEERELDDPPV